MKKEEIELGMVFTFGNNPDIEYVVVGLYPDDVSLERINQRSENNNRHASGYGWFTYDSTKYVRKMSKKELEKYQTSDPVCNFENGIYITKKDIVNIDLKTLADDGEVIDISQIDCDKNSYGDNFYLEITFKRFGYEDDFTAIFYENTKMACIHLFWRLLKKINVNP